MRPVRTTGDDTRATTAKAIDASLGLREYLRNAQLAVFVPVELAELRGCGSQLLFAKPPVAVSVNLARKSGSAERKTKETPATVALTSGVAFESLAAIITIRSDAFGIASSEALASLTSAPFAAFAVSVARCGLHEELVLENAIVALLVEPINARS